MILDIAGRLDPHHGTCVVLYPRARVLIIVSILKLFFVVRIPLFVLIGGWFAIELMLVSGLLLGPLLSGASGR